MEWHVSMHWCVGIQLAQCRNEACHACGKFGCVAEGQFCCKIRIVKKPHTMSELNRPCLSVTPIRGQDKALLQNNNVKRTMPDIRKVNLTWKFFRPADFTCIQPFVDTRDNVCNGLLR